MFSFGIGQIHKMSTLYVDLKLTPINLILRHLFAMLAFFPEPRLDLRMLLKPSEIASYLTTTKSPDTS